MRNTFSNQTPRTLPIAFLILAVEVAALPKVIQLGGLFDNEDIEQELGFRLAVDSFNYIRDKSTPRIVAQVANISNGDVYDATKKVCSLLEKGVVGVFGPQDYLTSLHVSSICDELEVPHIETRWDYMHKRDSLSINLHPCPSVLSDCYVAMIKHMGWKNFTIMYEESDGIIRLQKVLKVANQMKWRVHIYRFEKDIPYRKVFWQVKKDMQKINDLHPKIVLDVNRKNLYTVLKHAQEVGMMTENQQYFSTCLDLHTIEFEEFKYSKANITGFRLVETASNDYQPLLEAMASPPYNYETSYQYGIKTETALMFDAVRMFIQALQEFDKGKEVKKFPSISCNSVTTTGTDGTSLINYMKSVKMYGITGEVQFSSEGFRTKFKLDLMNLQEEGLIKYGDMHPGQDIKITRKLPVETPTDVQKFIITTILGKPYVMMKNSTKNLKGNERYEGFCVDMIKELADILNFKYVIKLVADSEYGEKQKNGSWTGMIGEVMDGKAHMAVAGLSVTSIREEAVDFTMPFLDTGISILFKKPSTKVTSVFSFLSPFSATVWIYMLMAYFGTSVMTFLVGRLSPYEWINPHPCRQDDIVVENEFNLRNSLWFVIGTILQEGTELVPTATSTRIAGAFLGFFTLIMISSYTANLAAFLTVEKSIYPFNNVFELEAQDVVKYGCVKSGATKTFFSDSSDRRYQKMWRTMSSNPGNLAVDDGEGRAKVLAGNYAFFMEATTIKYIIERECNLTQIGGLLDNKGYGIATKKGRRELSDHLSFGIIRLQENGVLHTLKQRWWTQKGGGKCVESKQASSAVKELTLHNVGGIFVVLIFGLGVSIILAVLEFRWKSAQWENPNKESFWTRMRNELKFALTFDALTKAVPEMKKSRSTTAEHSRSGSQGTNGS